MKNDVILVVSDLHMPYHHIDTIGFLRAIKRKYKPTRVILTGDEIDAHAMSFHDKDPDLFSPGQELEMAIKYMKPVYDMFPSADIMESNHGSLVYRRGKWAGLPRSVFKSYQEILEAPKGWQWHKDLVIKLPNKLECYFSHGMSGDAFKVARSMGCSVAQGHRHSDFYIKWFKTARGVNFAMSVGAMLDIDCKAANYARYSNMKTVYGHGIIIKGIPKLLPMHLNSKGRWDKNLV